MQGDTRLAGDKTDASYPHSEAFGATPALPVSRERELVEQLLARAPLQIGAVDGPEHRFAWVNEAVLRRTGGRSEDYLGRRLVDVLPDVHAAIGPLLDQVLATGGELVRPEQLIPGSPGGPRYVHLTLAPVRGPGGRPTGVMMMMLDLTERKHAEAEREKLRAELDVQHELFEAVLRDLPVGVMILEPATRRLVFANQRLAELFHLDLRSDQAQVDAGLRGVAGVGVDGRAYGREDWPLARSFHTGERIEHEQIDLTLADGARLVVDASSSVVRQKDGRIIAGVATFSDVTESRRAEAERSQLLASEQAAHAEAELANRLKDEFLARVSHELATPLAAMKMWIHLLRLGDPAHAAHALEAIDQCATAQSKLIEDLLDVARAISGKLRIKLEPIDPLPVIEAAANAIKPQADQKSIHLETTSAARVGRILGDGSRLQQIVTNLLSNAVKFTPAGGHVWVRVERANGEVRIRVSDDGQGIAPDVLPHVFVPFRQGDRSITREHGGLGLGLSIVHQLVQLHGGAVSADSPGAGGGATFTVTLPAAEDGARVEKASGEEAPAARRTAAIDDIDVLVVDDDDPTREGLALVLENYGAHVRAVSSADAALKEIARTPPDVLLCDIAMPGEDGYSLIRKVRALGGDAARVPAAAITAHGRVEDRIRALTSGFQQHVVKPVEPSELAVVIASLAGRL